MKVESLQGLRMLCAFIHSGKFIWVTCLQWPAAIGVYLCTNPSLNHDANNVSLDEFDHSTVAVDFGIYANEANFVDRALGV